MIQWVENTSITVLFKCTDKNFAKQIQGKSSVCKACYHWQRCLHILLVQRYHRIKAWLPRLKRVNWWKQRLWKTVIEFHKRVHGKAVIQVLKLGGEWLGWRLRPATENRTLPPWPYRQRRVWKRDAATARRTGIKPQTVGSCRGWPLLL